MSANERFNLTGKIALVTGGSRGIGRGIAIGLAEHGADVAIVYRSAEDEANRVAEAIQKLGRRAWVYQQDLAAIDELAALADRIWSDCGQVDVLVNNAGMAYLERYDEISLEHWRRVLAINLDAVFFLLRMPVDSNSMATAFFVPVMARAPASAPRARTRMTSRSRLTGPGGAPNRSVISSTISSTSSRDCTPLTRL